MLSPRLLEILRLYWHDAHPREWLFPGDIPGHPITRSAVALACRIARQRSGIQKPITPHSLRHYLTFLIMSGDTVELPRPSEDYWLRRRQAQLITRHNFLCSTKPKSWFAGW